MRSFDEARCRTLVLFVLVSLTMTSSASAQRRRTALDAVATAMGGRTRIMAVKTVSMVGRGFNYNLGQNPGPNDSLPMYEVTEFRRIADFAQGRWRVEQSRVPRFITANAAAQRQISAGDK